MTKTIIAAMILLTGCADLPRDVEGTMERVRTTKVLRVGFVSGDEQFSGPAHRRFIANVAKETGSKPHVVSGSAETLLPQLERGDLDIVAGDFTATTPWGKRVTIMPTPPRLGVVDGKPAPAAVVRNGENGWVALVHRHADVLKEGRR